jgi:cysteinyl-tRNA synthetase
LINTILILSDCFSAQLDGINLWISRKIYFVYLLNYSEDGLEAASKHEKYFGEFFQNMKVWIRENDLKKDLKFDQNDNSITKILQEKKIIIHEALCDNFNTPLVLKNLQELISKTYDYEVKTRSTTFKLHTAFSIAQFVAHILKSLGLVYRNEFLDYFIVDSNQQSSEEVLSPYIDASVKFRDSIKSAAAIDKDLIKVLKLCDQLRDDVYPYLGIKIEDQGKGVPSIWKFYDKETYVKELQRQKEQAEMARLKKEELNKENELKVSSY